MKIWIMNHYASDMFRDKAGRHYWFAKFLEKSEYEVTIFCASSFHNTGEGIQTDGHRFLIKKDGNTPFVFVYTKPSQGNGIDRVINMLQFYRGLFPATRSYAHADGKPDIILASSVHPLTLLAGIKIAKKLKVPCVCEVRDLWPESLVAYGLVKGCLITKAMYAFEKHLYARAHAVIFTMAGGAEYIREKGWDSENGGTISLKKVYHINNGVDLEMFNYNTAHYPVEDKDLSNKNWFNLVYAGSVGFANNLNLVLDAAKLLHNTKVRFLVWGTGSELARLQKRCRDEKIKNVLFKGYISRNQMPSILTQADATFFVLHDSPLYRFGLSLNKSFEYFAAGKPTLIVGKAKYSLVDQYACGLHVSEATPQGLEKAVIALLNLDQDAYDRMGLNAKSCAQDYDFGVLTQKLVDLLKEVSDEENLPFNQRS